jgi:excisionase family DNA binding protein
VTPASRCANGKRCACAPALGDPTRLSRSNTDTVCFACRERAIDAQLPPAATPDRTYTVTEAAGLIGVPRTRLEYLVMSGQLRAAKAGPRGLWMIAEEDLLRVGEAS